MSEQVKLGKVAMTLGGDYNSSQSYDKLTCVQYDGCSWVSKKQVPEGVAPTPANTAYWQKISDRGVQGPQGQSYVDKELVPIVNDLTTGGSANVLSAEQGKVLKGELAELSGYANSHYVKEGVKTYTTIKDFPFVLRKGAIIINNGIPFIVANNASLDGRVNVYNRGSEIVLDSDKFYIQSVNEEGTIDFNYIMYPTLFEFQEYKERAYAELYAQMTSNVINYTSTILNEQIPLESPLRAGTRITNKGITILLADDYLLNGRITLMQGDSIVLEKDKAHLQAYQQTGEVLVECQFLLAQSISSREIRDNSISEDKTTFVIPANLVDSNAIREGVYYETATNLYRANSNYNATGKITAIPKTSYVANRRARYWAFMNLSLGLYQDFQSVAEYTPVIAPDWANEQCITFYANDTDYNIIQGEIWQYLGEHSDRKILPSLLPPSNDVLLKDISARGTLDLNTELITPLVHITKNIAMSAVIRGNISDIRMGVALNGTYGKSIRITNSNIIEHSGSNDIQGKSIEHGLNLTELTFVSMSKGDDAKMKIRIATDTGDFFETEIAWALCVGQPFFRNNGDSVIDVAFTFQPRDIDKDIWMFGDSYFGMYSEARWPYYMLTWGFTNFLLDARSGESAPEALIDLQNLIATGHRPKYIVWCHGMNGGRDNGDSVNSTWLKTTNQMLSLCKTYGITPILATIPSVPSEIHANLNAWIKASGHRYIDFASAVEADDSLYWKGWGTSDALLSNDEIHPSVKGAFVLASQVLNDFAEITIV